MDLKSFLGQIPLLSGLDAVVLDDLAESMHVRQVKDGHVFIREGTHGDTLFVVMEGSVAVTSRMGAQQRELDVLGPQEFFGLIALVDDSLRAATCTARGPVTVASISRETFDRLVDVHPTLGLAWARILGTQLARDYRNIARRVRDLLNAPPRVEAIPAEKEYDVIVMGGGPLGLAYATWLKTARPQTRIAVIERRDKPGYKIGESTLGTTTRALRSIGLSLPILRRLFGNKLGIRFFHTDMDTDELHCHVDATDIDETFQVERRVLEIALLETTRRLGVEIFQGTSVHLKESQLEGPLKQIVCDRGGQQMTLYCRLFCDASGSSSVLPRQLGLYHKRPEQYETFNTSSYFAYFRKKKDVPLKYWDLPATRHVCFPQGWTWFITLVSWEQTSDENITRMIRHLLDLPQGPDESYPSRQQLCEEFDCKYEVLTGVGFTIREDRDTAAALPVLERFQHYVDRYPAIKWILSHYELVEDAYEKRKPYGAFLKLAHDSDRVAGDGWCVIGDAAQFSNPLFSHGLNYGTGTAYMAMKDTVRALDKGDFSEQAFASYQQYARSVYPVLLHQTDMLYRSFNDVDSYERVLALIFFFGAQDVLPRTEYSESDPFIFDLLNPAWIEKVEAVRLAQKRGEEQGTPPSEVAREVDAIVTPFVEGILKQPEVQALQVGTVFSEYTNEGVRQEGRQKPPGPFIYFQCPTCHFYDDGTLEKCPICGTPSPLKRM
jgi:flavin-dependent dehydrogenase